jgi:hypothetical protein
MAEYTPDVPRPFLEPDERARLYAKLKKLDNGCWHYDARPSSSRTGAFSRNDGRFLVAHRAFYTAETGVSLKPQDVLIPLCEDQECCNPAHQQKERRRHRKHEQTPTTMAIAAHPNVPHRVDVAAFLSQPRHGCLTYASGATMVLTPWGNFSHNDGVEAAVRRALEEKPS